ncbi:MAG TPA: AAA family ATPase, partial [Propionibacteriaceae bacterium]|nr:AAA family ATPase [Propionibacteriaceae bacterium]
MTDARLPDPALVVLAGAAGSGKSTWAAERFRAAEVVSSDALRAAVGSGPSDLDASVEAFVLLDQIIAARAKRSLMTVIDTLGLDPVRRTEYLQLARAAGLPAVLVIMNTAAALCRERNRLRDRPVPAPVLTEQLRRISRLMESANEEGWDRVLIIDQDPVPNAPSNEVVADHDHAPETRPRVILQVSRFPWGEENPRAWLCDMAL